MRQNLDPGEVDDNFNVDENSEDDFLDTVDDNHEIPEPVPKKINSNKRRRKN